MIQQAQDIIELKELVKNPTIARRLVKLKEEIEKQIKRIENEENKELVEISYLYYDEYDQKSSISIFIPK